jgi:hypothetical protein
VAGHSESKKWAFVENVDDVVTERLSVPGGWLYRVIVWRTPDELGDSVAGSVAMAFVPVPGD